MSAEKEFEKLTKAGLVGDLTPWGLFAAGYSAGWQAHASDVAANDMSSKPVAETQELRQVPAQDEVARKGLQVGASGFTQAACHPHRQEKSDGKCVQCAYAQDATTTNLLTTTKISSSQTQNGCICGQLGYPIRKCSKCGVGNDGR